MTLLGLKAEWGPLRALAVAVAFAVGVGVGVGVDNATDKLHELDAGFPAAGRTWYANLRHEF